jgi:hypothetical protein
MVALHTAKNRVAVMSVLRAFIVGAVMAGCLAVPVYAKERVNPLKTDEDQRRKDDVAIDTEYKATLQRTRKDTTGAPASDPWQNMRGGDDSKSKR